MFILLSFLFSNKLTGKIRKLIFRITVGAYIVILVARLLISSPDNSFDNTLVSINNYFYAIWILMIIREQFEKSEIISLDYYSSFFWYMLGIFLYSVGTMLFFILWYDLDKENYKELKIWLHSIFNILMYIFFAIGLWISALKTKTVKVN